MSTTKEMMEKLQEKPDYSKPNKQQLEQNIQISHNWIKAITSGTFPGHASLHIATLLDFLQRQHQDATKEFESLHPAPEFGKPEAK
jgi:lipopolysaccharide biosynthesis regulator YciM